MSDNHSSCSQSGALSVIRSSQDTPSSCANESRQTHAELFRNIADKNDGNTFSRSSEEETENCECGHDLFNQVLGPTADEAILSGLSSIKIFVERLLNCGGDSSANEPPPPKCCCEVQGNKCLNEKCQTETCRGVDCGVCRSNTKCCCACCQTDTCCPPPRCIQSKAVCCNLKCSSQHSKPRMCKCCKPSRCCLENRKEKTCACKRSDIKRKRSAFKCCKPCDSGKGDQADETCPCQVKYAITKIIEFEDYTTYEVMRSTHCTPKKMPKCVEGVFVLKRKTCS